MKTFKRIETKLIHSGEPHPRVMGAVSLPIFQTAMFEYAGEESYHDIRYIRLNNSPNHVALHQKLENAAPKLPKEATPRQIDEAQRALAAAIQSARAGAKRGDLFTPEMTVFV